MLSAASSIRPLCARRYLAGCLGLGLLAIAGMAQAEPAPTAPEFVGHSYDLQYDNGFRVRDQFAADQTLIFTVLSGPQRGRHGQVHYQWQAIAPRIYAIEWTESDGGSIVHIDDFQQRLSRSYYSPGSGRLIYSQAAIP